MGTETVPHCAVLSSFAATMGKVSRAADGRASFGIVPQPFKLKKIHESNKYILKVLGLLKEILYN